MSTPMERQLSESEARLVFERDIRPTLRGPSQENPRVLLLGGPQGSGKTTTLPTVARQLGLEQATRIDGDDLFDFHPRYDALARERGALGAAKACAGDFDQFMELALSTVRDQRQDLILVGPYTHPELTFARLREFTGEGYRAELAYMALHLAETQLSTMHRHQRAMEAGVGYSFLVPVEMQQSVFDGVPVMLAQAEKNHAASALHLIDRQGVVFSKALTDGVWHPATPATVVLETTRGRPMQPEEAALFQQRREAVGRVSYSEDWTARLASVDRLAAERSRVGSGSTTGSPSTPAVYRPSAKSASAATSDSDVKGHSPGRLTGR